jgi:hypothetical protein
MTMQAKNFMELARQFNVTRKIDDNFFSTDTVSRLRGCFRTITDPLHINDIAGAGRTFVVTVIDSIKALSTNINSAEYKRVITETTTIQDSIKMIAVHVRNVIENITANTATKTPFVLIRRIADGVLSLGEAGHIGDYLRGVAEQVTGIGRSERYFTLIRTLTEGMAATDTLKRKLDVLVKIITGCYVRDYVIKRFLIARDEIVIKSRITRELELDSRIF